MYFQISVRNFLWKALAMNGDLSGAPCDCNIYELVLFSYEYHGTCHCFLSSWFGESYSAVFRVYQVMIFFRP